MIFVLCATVSVALVVIEAGRINRVSLSAVWSTGFCQHGGKYVGAILGGLGSVMFFECWGCRVMQLGDMD